jgi:hypothetical protein
MLSSGSGSRLDGACRIAASHPGGAVMPRLFSAVIALVVGYLDGAALGAVSYDFLATLGPDKELKIALVAALATGPLGALLGVIFAMTPPIGAEPAKPAE